MTTRTRPRVYIGMSHPGRRRRAVRLLRQDGWVVREADDGYDLVHLLNTALLSDDESKRPDLLIADATLNGLTGLSLLQGIRQLEWATPVIVLVDFNRPETVALAQELGATQVIEKPVDPETLRDAARALRPRASAALHPHRARRGRGQRELPTEGDRDTRGQSARSRATPATASGSDSSLPDAGTETA